MKLIDKLNDDIDKLKEENAKLKDIIYGPDIKPSTLPECECKTLRMGDIGTDGYEFVDDIVIIHCNRCNADQVYLKEDIMTKRDSINRRKTKRGGIGPLMP